MDAKIIIATHKKYWMPADEIYLPLFVGAALNYDSKTGYARDDTGENISRKNKNYCELTGLYWVWKNQDAEYVGLVHYRRHFTKCILFGSKKDRVMDMDYLEKMAVKSDILLPKKRHYYIETNYSQYVHAHHKEDLIITRKIIGKLYPEYIQAYDKVMHRTYGHRFNMFIMKKNKLDEYCSWLFAVLYELEKRLDISKYSANDARVFGFVAERLLDVWLEKNQYDYKELPYVFMENQNWIKKGFSFLKRKFVGKG